MNASPRLFTTKVKRYSADDQGKGKKWGKKKGAAKIKRGGS